MARPRFSLMEGLINLNPLKNKKKIGPSGGLLRGPAPAPGGAPGRVAKTSYERLAWAGQITGTALFPMKDAEPPDSAPSGLTRASY